MENNYDEIEIKKDCFAYKQGKCKALKKLYCKKEKCSFYQKKGDEENEDIK